MVDKAKLERAAGVVFSDEQVRDLIVEIEVCDHERHNVYPNERKRYYKLKELSERAATLGYEFAPVELTGSWHEPRLWLQFMLGLSASKIEEIWRGAGGTGKPGWNDKAGRWSGPVTNLVLALYEEAGIDPKRRPSRSAIRDGMRLFADMTSERTDTGAAG